MPRTAARRALAGALLCCAALALVGCSGALVGGEPCRVDDDCPPGYACDALSRCAMATSAEAPVIDDDVEPFAPPRRPGAPPDHAPSPAGDDAGPGAGDDGGAGAGGGGVDVVDEVDAGPVQPAPLAPCQARFVVEHDAPAPHPGYAVRVEVPALPGLSDDASNLRVFTGSFAPLPFWIEVGSPSGAVVHARLAPLPPGATTIVVDACDPHAHDADGEAAFDFFLSRPVAEGGGLVCDANQYAEGCFVEGDHEVVTVNAQASCWRDPYDGASAVLDLPLPLATGAYVVEGTAFFGGDHEDYCSGYIQPRVSVTLGNAAVFSEQCYASACDGCSSAAPLGGSLALVAPASLRVSVDATDCSFAWAGLARLRMQRALQGAVRVVPDP